MSPRAPVCSPTLTISSGSASSMPVDSRAVVRLAPSRMRPVAVPTARAMARLPMEAAATSRAFIRGSPPASRVESVRMSWLVAYILMRPPKYGSAQQGPVEDDAGPLPPEPVHDGRHQDADPQDDPEEVRADRGGHGEQHAGGQRQLGPEALVEALELGDHPDEEDGHEAGHHRQEHDRVDGGGDGLLLAASG